MAVQKSSHSLSMEIIAPDWRWGEMCAFLALVGSKGLRLSSALWVPCMRLPSSRINRGPGVVLTLLLQGVFTLMKFCVAPVSAMPYVELILVGFPLHLLQLLFVFVKYSSTLVISLLNKHFLLLYPVSEPNRHMTSRTCFRSSCSRLLPSLFSLLPWNCIVLRHSFRPHESRSMDCSTSFNSCIPRRWFSCCYGLLDLSLGS